MANTTNPLLVPSSTLDDIASTSIEDFIISGLDENYTVELKTYSKEDKECNYKIRKAIASLANQQGGFLLIGIKDKKNSKNKTSTKERIVGHKVIEEIQKWIDDICGKDLMIPRVSYQSTNVTVGGKDVVVVAVQAYLISPVGVKKDGSSMLEFWIRGNGSDLSMDYMDLSRRYQSDRSSLVSAAFIDLMDTFGDLVKLHKKPPKLDSLNPIKIVSSVVEDRKTLYGITDYDHQLATHINNLRRFLPVINTLFDLGNKNHMEGKVISNAAELSKQLGNYCGAASEQIINIMSDLYRLFPEVGYRYMKSLTEEYDLDIMSDSSS